MIVEKIEIKRGEKTIKKQKARLIDINRGNTFLKTF